MSWKLKEWNDVYNKETGKKLPPMSKDEIASAIEYLRENSYPKPEDCPELDCPDYKPSCKLNVCSIAVGMCGDF